MYKRVVPILGSRLEFGPPWEWYGVSRSVDRDFGKPFERLGLTLDGCFYELPRSLVQGQGERRAVALRRHFAEGFSEDVDDLIVVVMRIFGVELVEIVFEENDRRDIFQRLALGIFFSCSLRMSVPTWAIDASS